MSINTIAQINHFLSPCNITDEFLTLRKRILYAFDKEIERLLDANKCQKYLISGFIKEEETNSDISVYYKNVPRQVVNFYSYNSNKLCVFYIYGFLVEGEIESLTEQEIKITVQRSELEMLRSNHVDVNKEIKNGILFVDKSDFFIMHLYWFIRRNLRAINPIFDALRKNVTPIYTGIEVHPFNEINAAQHAAVMKAIEQRVSFLWGPPGTGKTNTLAVLVANLIRSGKRVLIAAPSNTAVDQLLEATCCLLDTFNYDRNKVVRLGSTKNDRLKCFTKSFLFSGVNVLNLNKFNYRINWNNYINRCCLCASTIFSLTLLGNNAIGYFDFVIVDEVSMANVPSLMVPASFSRNVVVFGGDSMQLPPPIPYNPKDQDRWFCDSIFEKAGIVNYNDPMVAFLDTQYRMQGEIGELVSQVFYKGHLKNGTVAIPRNEKFPSRILFVNTAGCVSNLSGVINYGEEKTRYNENHAKIILYTVQFSLQSGFKESEIGVICPYNAQVDLVSSYLRKAGINEVKVSTVHLFQGQEMKQIIVDLTDDDVKPTQLTADQRLINVAISRAKEQLILVGNLDYLLNRKFFSESEVNIFRMILNHATVLPESFFSQ